MFRIGIDLGGTNIVAGLVDEEYKIRFKSKLPTNADRPAEKIAADMAQVCINVCKDAKITMDEVEFIGVVSPGLVNRDEGTIECASNLPFRHFPIASFLMEKTGVKAVKVENDANAAALGEAVAGAAKGANCSVMVTLGTGVGGGIIVDNKILSGFNFAGGELGHMVIEKDGVPCNCGRKGCWESYSSATALIRMTEEKLDECRKNNRDTIMFNAPYVSGRTACDAMRKGDAAAKEVYDKYISYLATGLGNIINIFQPQIICLGGGVSNEGQSLIDNLLPLVRKEQYLGGGFVELTELRIAKLGNDAGIIGATAL